MALWKQKMGLIELREIAVRSSALGPRPSPLAPRPTPSVLLLLAVNILAPCLASQVAQREMALTRREQELIRREGENERMAKKLAQLQGLKMATHTPAKKSVDGRMCSKLPTATGAAGAAGENCALM